MRVALVSTSWLDFYVVELVKALAPRHEVLVVVDQHDTLHNALALPSVKVVRLPWLPSRRHPLRNLRAVRELTATLSAFRPDVIHFQEHDPRIPLLMPLLSRLPIVMDLHNVDPLPGMEAPVRDRLRDLTRSRIDAFVVHGSAMRSAMHNRYGTTAGAVFEIPFGLFSAFGESSLPRDGGEPPVALFFGRIQAYKGVDTLIAAGSHVAAAFRGDFRIRIAGEGNLGPYLPVDEKIFEIVNERVPHPAPLFQEADLIVLPYSHASTSGVTPVAYAHSKPAIVTNVGCLAETVQHGVTGLVVPPHDPVALGNAIASLLSDATLRQKMGQAGRALLDGELNWTRNIGQVEAAYTHAVSRRQQVGWAFSGSNS